MSDAGLGLLLDAGLGLRLDAGLGLGSGLQRLSFVTCGCVCLVLGFRRRAHRYALGACLGEG